MRILVAYFSASGITREVAEKIAAVAGEGGASGIDAGGGSVGAAKIAGANSNLTGTSGGNSNLASACSTNGGNGENIGTNSANNPNSNLAGVDGANFTCAAGANSNLASTDGTSVANSNLAGATGANVAAHAKNQVALFEITPQIPYCAADLDWTNPRSRTTIECKDKSCRPALAQMADISGFDAVIIGFPVWWYTAPNVIFTFLESADFGGKIIVPFCTGGGSGLDPAPRDMQKSAPTARFLQGRRFDFGEGKSAIRKWLAGLGLL